MKNYGSAKVSSCVMSLSNRLFWSGGKSPTSPVVLWKNEKDICNMRTPEFAAKARKQGCFIHFN
jgi:hypothetical protein